MRSVHWRAKLWKTLTSVELASRVRWHHLQSQKMSWPPRTFTVLDLKKSFSKFHMVSHWPFPSSVAKVLWASLKMSSSALECCETVLPTILMTVCVCVYVCVCVCVYVCVCDCHCVTTPVKILMWWTDFVYLRFTQRACCQCAHLFFHVSCLLFKQETLPSQTMC